MGSIVRLGAFWVAALVAVAGCQPVPAPATLAEPQPVDGVGYILINAPITVSTRDLLLKDIDRLHTAGANEIHLAINSPGGDVDAAQSIVADMNRLHAAGITFKAYNVGIVASAATYIFLNAQNRYTTARGAFLFHAAGLVSNGAVSAERLRDEVTKLDSYERLMRATLKERTHLTDGETLTYVRRTVILNADDARRDGVVDAIADFNMPRSARAWIIAVKPATPAPTPPASPPR